MKYIVYLTINLLNFNIYVGVHGINGDGKDAYLGNGVYGNKPWTYKHPKYPIQFAIKKYGPKNFHRITLAEFDTEIEALNLEGLIVNEEFIKLPWTYNVALGGGKIPPTNKHIYQYSLTGEFINSFESVRDVERELGFNHSSVANSVRFKSTSHGFLWSYTKYDRLDITQYNIFDSSCPVYLYNLDGSFAKECDSIKHTADFLNTVSTRISHSIRTGGICNGYYITKEKLEHFTIKNKFRVKNKPIYQYTVNGEYLNSWECITDVWKHFQLTSAGPITNAIKKGTVSCGFRWSLDKVPQLPQLHKTAKKVGIFKDGDLLCSYKSVKAFRKEHSSYEWACLKSGCPTNDGRLIKYIS